MTHTAYVVTANDFHDGEVVFWLAPGQWTRSLDEAHRFDERIEAEAEQDEAKAHQVVGAYVMEVDVTNGGLTPRHVREAIRASGPTNYFHGKQQSFSRQQDEAATRPSCGGK